MSKRILILGALVLLAVGAGTLLRDRRVALEADLRLEAIRQLSLERVMGVNPDFHGRKVTLRGKVVSEGEKRRAEAVVGAVEGVAEVTNALEIGPLHPPASLRYFLDIAWKDEGINLWGRVPDEATKASLLDVGAEGFGPEAVIDRLEVVVESLGPVDWFARVSPLLPELLARVSPGRVKARDDRVVLAGFVADEADGKALEELFRQRLPDLEVESRLRVDDGEEAPAQGKI